VEDDLLAMTGSDDNKSNSKYFHQLFEGDNTNGEEDADPAEEGNETREEHESGKTSRQKKVVKPKNRRKSLEKCEGRKGKQPVRPAGYRELMSSISKAGQSGTVSRHQLMKKPTAVTFGRGRDNIPHGLTFNAPGKKKGRGTGQLDSGVSSNGSSDDDDPNLGERSLGIGRRSVVLIKIIMDPRESL